MSTQRKGVLLPFPSDNSHNTHNCCNSVYPLHVSEGETKQKCSTFLSLLFCVFLTLFILHGVQNLWVLELRIRLEGALVSLSFQWNTCSLGPDVPSSLGALEWDLLVHFTLINFKIFTWLFLGFFCMAVSYYVGRHLHRCSYAVFPFIFSLFLSLPGTTSLCSPLLPIIGDYGDLRLPCKPSTLCA